MRSAEDIARVIFKHAAEISKLHAITPLLHSNSALARELTGAERCSLWLIDPRTGELWTRVADGVGELRIPGQQGIIGACISSEMPILANDVHCDSRFLSTIDNSTGFTTQNVLCVPILAEKKVIGALQLLNKTAGFDNEDVDILQLMSVYTGVAIETERLREEAESARWMNRELEIAREVQQKLLSNSVGAIPGLECAGFCRPAQAIGGDYYDIMELPDRALGITLGDVSGKGIPAALLMASIQSLLRGLMVRNPFDLGGLLTDINAALYRISTAANYSTLFCAVLNNRHNELTFVNAGHIPAFIVRHKDGSILRASEGGLPIGLMPSISYRSCTVPISPDDLFVAISDGVLDLGAGDDVWNEEILGAFLQRSRHRSVEEIGQSLITELDRLADGKKQFDDITVVALRVPIA